MRRSFYFVHAATIEPLVRIPHPLFLDSCDYGPRDFTLVNDIDSDFDYSPILPSFAHMDKEEILARVFWSCIVFFG